MTGELKTDDQLRTTTKALLMEAMTCINESRFEQAAEKNRQATEVFNHIREPSAEDDPIIHQGIKISLVLFCHEMNKNPVGGQTDGAKNDEQTSHGGGISIDDFTEIRKRPASVELTPSEQSMTLDHARRVIALREQEIQDLNEQINRMRQEFQEASRLNRNRDSKLRNALYCALNNDEKLQSAITYLQKNMHQHQTAQRGIQSTIDGIIGCLEH